MQPKTLSDLKRAKKQIEFVKSVEKYGGEALTKDRTITNAVTYAMIKVFYLGLNSTKVTTPLHTILVNEVNAIISLTPLQKEQLNRCCRKLSEIAYQAGLNYEG